NTLRAKYQKGVGKLLSGYLSTPTALLAKSRPSYPLFHRIIALTNREFPPMGMRPHTQSTLLASGSLIWLLALGCRTPFVDDVASSELNSTFHPMAIQSPALEEDSDNHLYQEVNAFE